MSKDTLNLSIEKGIKRRAKKIAKEKGLSVSQFFERLIAKEDEEGGFTPTPGTAAYELSNIIPESEKLDDYDYKKMKGEMLEERYGIKQSTD